MAVASAAVHSSLANEHQAVDLVFRATHQLYPKESLRCFSLLTEETTRRRFEIAVYEKHNRRCGGDPNVMNVRDRFRVDRLPIRLWRYDVGEGKYLRCRVTRPSPACPRLSYE